MTSLMNKARTNLKKDHQHNPGHSEPHLDGQAGKSSTCHKDQHEAGVLSSSLFACLSHHAAIISPQASLNVESFSPG